MGDIVRAMQGLVVPRKSTTLEEDRSEPPTPDGTGFPTNFHEVAPGIYRSSFPLTAHFEELKKMNLRTILTLVPEEYPAANTDFMKLHGINHAQIHILANKDPEIYTPSETVVEALKVVMNRANHPILIHCNKGRHRTGCITACFRKVCGWTLPNCLEEYISHSAPKSRDLDKAFIARFDETPLKALALEQGFVGGAYLPLPTPSNSNASDKDTSTSSSALY